MKMVAEVTDRQRRNAFWKELDFVASDMALEFLGDFALVRVACILYVCTYSVHIHRGNELRGNEP
jgi:hypothetical protein